jgi:hypothetical protein
MWDSFLHLYEKYKTFTKKYNVLFCPHYFLWIIPTSDMGLGRALCLNLWYELGLSFMSQPLVRAWAELSASTSGMGLDRALSQPLLQKGMGQPFCGLISYFNFPTSSYKLIKKWSMLTIQIII